MDRSVSGLIAQQSCVGQFHVPLSDVAVVAITFTDTVSIFYSCRRFTFAVSWFKIRGNSIILREHCIIVRTFQIFQVGAATAIGEQPMKILVNPEAGARMSVAEAMTNLCMAVVSDIKVTSVFLNFQMLEYLFGGNVGRLLMFLLHSAIQHDGLGTTMVLQSLRYVYFF